MFFYASFGLLLVLFRNRLLLLVALTVLFGSLVVAGSFLKNDAAIAVTYTSSRLFEFLAGVFAAYLLLYWPRLPMRRVVAWTLMAGGWALLVHVGFFEGSVASLIAGSSPSSSQRLPSIAPVPAARIPFSNYSVMRHIQSTSFIFSFLAHSSKCCCDLLRPATLYPDRHVHQRGHCAKRMCRRADVFVL